MIKLNVDTFKQRFPHIGSALQEDELTVLITLLKIQIVEASEALIVAGTETDSLYFVWEGQLEVMLPSPNGEYQVATVEIGELLGEISLLSPGKTTATVRSESGCIALHLDVPSLEIFWEQHPHAASVFLQEINRLVTRRIRNVDETIKALKTVDASNSDKLMNAQQELLKG